MESTTRAAAITVFADRLDPRNRAGLRTLDPVPCGQVRSFDHSGPCSELHRILPEALCQYVRQLARKMKPRAHGFINHSHAAPYASILRFGEWVSSRKIPRISSLALRKLGRNWRALDMSADSMAAFLREAGMSSTSQEIFSIADLAFPLDCVSTFVNQPSDAVPIRKRIDLYAMLRKISSKTEDENQKER